MWRVDEKINDPPLGEDVGFLVYKTVVHPNAEPEGGCSADRLHDILDVVMEDGHDGISLFLAVEPARPRVGIRQGLGRLGATVQAPRPHARSILHCQYLQRVLAWPRSVRALPGPRSAYDRRRSSTVRLHTVVVKALLSQATPKVRW